MGIHEWMCDVLWMLELVNTGMLGRRKYRTLDITKICCWKCIKSTKKCIRKECTRSVNPSSERPLSWTSLLLSSCFLDISTWMSHGQFNSASLKLNLFCLLNPQSSKPFPPSSFSSQKLGSYPQLSTFSLITALSTNQQIIDVNSCITLQSTHSSSSPLHIPNSSTLLRPQK